MTTIKMIATGTLQQCEELKAKIRWLEIAAIQREFQHSINRDFYNGTKTKSFLTVNPSLVAAPEFTLEDAFQRYAREHKDVPDKLTVHADAQFGSVFTQDIKTRLSPYALMAEFNKPDTQPTFLRMLGEGRVELYNTPELAVSRVGAEQVIGTFKSDYSWFDKRDTIKAHHP